MATQGRTGNPRHGAVTLSSGSASIKTGKSLCLLSQGLGEGGGGGAASGPSTAVAGQNIHSHLCHWLAFLCLAEWEPCQPLGNHHPACPVEAAPEAESYPNQPAQGQSRGGSYRSRSCVISCSCLLLHPGLTVPQRLSHCTRAVPLACLPDGHVQWLLL